MTDSHSITYSPQEQQALTEIKDAHVYRHWYDEINTPYNRKKAQDEYWDVEPMWRKRAKRHAMTATIEFQGELVKVITKQITPIVGQGGKRRPITEFSGKSRKHLLEIVSRMDWTVERATFITLTYHQAEYSAKRAKRDLRAFLKRLYRAYGIKAVLWRLEPQKRGSWHFHLLVWGLPYYPKSDLLKDWREVTGQGTITQCDIQLVENAKKARSYVAKYIAKPLPVVSLKVVSLLLAGIPMHSLLSYLDYATNLAEISSPGRFWGIENRKLIHWAQLVVCTMRIGSTFHDFKRYARRAWKGINNREGVGFSVFVRDVRQWYRLLATEAVYDDKAQFILWDNWLRLESGL